MTVMSERFKRKGHLVGIITTLKYIPIVVIGQSFTPWSRYT